MEVVSAIRLLPHTQGFAAKSGIISIKCGLCSRKTARTDTLLFSPSRLGHGDAPPFLETVYDADNPHQSTEVPYPAMTQVNFAIHMRQQVIDRATIDPGHRPQNIPINLLEPQTGGEAIQSYGAGEGLGQPHIELANKRINPYILVRTVSPLFLPFINHNADTPLPSGFFKAQLCVDL
ncbi:DNA-directed RNA polymerase [Pseudomonas sp. IT-P258]|nr:hypothetical protein ASD91_10225 [Pseudomonas sp. Root68]KRB65701.1 hypothetical protein ASD95_09530 [Pseudomonas sp. Root71]